MSKIKKITNKIKKFRYEIKVSVPNLLRYPGGKQRFLNCILPNMVPVSQLKGCYIEPFVGSGAIFFSYGPRKAILSDINRSLIDLFRGIRKYPTKVWKIYERFPSSRKAYYEIRDKHNKADLIYMAAKALFLNRTCFKGMWRENNQGNFNVGYGGQQRRWVINKDLLIDVSEKLERVKLLNLDFEKTIDLAKKNDYLFLDPPYKPGEKELHEAHYVYSKFTFDDQKRLAKALKNATNRGVKWIMTNSSHPSILKLFKKNRIIKFKVGTGNKPGMITNNTGEVLVCNY